MVKQKTFLTFYGGINEIGRNKVLSKDRGVRIFLDFGQLFTSVKTTLQTSSNTSK